jgi:hypothetical protein
MAVVAMLGHSMTDRVKFLELVVLELVTLQQQQLLS